MAEEIVIPKDLKAFLTEVSESKSGFHLGEPWKYSDKALAVVVPILRENSPDRLYITMYEVLKQLGINDTGHIDRVEMQNRAGKPVFVRAGTIFEGNTQSRAAEHSGIYEPGKVDIPVRCVHQTHGIATGAQMKFGDIAPLSVTSELIGDRGQGAVWHSVQSYNLFQTNLLSPSPRSAPCNVEPISHSLTMNRGSRGSSLYSGSFGEAGGNSIWGTGSSETTFTGGSFFNTAGSINTDLLGTMRATNAGKKALDEMMQKVPLFPDQVGAIIFDPIGVMAVESFDSPKSWEAIKKEIIEKYGDQVTNEQAEHLFELKPEKIRPLLKKFIQGMDKFEEKTIRKDELSETRAVKGEGVVGEYTLIRNRVMHTILVRAG
jgi:hypothetical protein